MILTKTERGRALLSDRRALSPRERQLLVLADGRRSTAELGRWLGFAVEPLVQRLLQEGYLERRAVAGDRRKTQLLCTEKAQPVIARGREVQERFFARLLDNTDAPTREAFFRTMEVIGKNLDEILKENG